ncbi:MAG TPA: hypothetical protein DEP65_13550 [Ruminococcus sp.]|nr:hypothetical protein [Ruminococcus sp.]
MTERERLIELLDKKYDHFCDQCGVNKDSRYTENLADYLLANDVKPLPFKINDIVYGISRGQIIPIQIDTIQYTSKGIDICGSNEKYFGYSTIHLDINNQIGIQWYKTKKEAETALKGGEEE